MIHRYITALFVIATSATVGGGLVLAVDHLLRAC